MPAGPDTSPHQQERNANYGCPTAAGSQPSSSDLGPQLLQLGRISIGRPRRGVSDRTMWRVRHEEGAVGLKDRRRGAQRRSRGPPSPEARMGAGLPNYIPFTNLTPGNHTTGIQACSLQSSVVCSAQLAKAFTGTTKEPQQQAQTS
jgi:hypothetical protein